MQYHLKEYENVFSEDAPNSIGRLRFDKISIVGMELNPYISLFRKFLGDYYINRFDGYVRFSWLRQAFCYYDKRTILPMQKNSRRLNAAFVKLLRRSVGKDPQVITRSRDFGRIETYFGELFPEFFDRNPFLEPEYYKFPFKNITMDFLLVVYQMDNRLQLLREADEKNMPIGKFMDYVLEYLSVENAKLPVGKEKYQAMFKKNRVFPFYIINLNRKRK